MPANSASTHHQQQTSLQFSGPNAGTGCKNWLQMGGAPAEVISLHLRTLIVFHNAKCYQGTAAGRCIATVVLNLANASLCLTSSSHFSQQLIFYSASRHLWTAVYCPRQTRADPWVYQTIFHACRAHRQNLLSRHSSLSWTSLVFPSCQPVFPDCQPVFPGGQPAFPDSQLKK